MSKGSVNKVILIGNLGADPEVRYTQGGTAIGNVRLATSEQWRDRNTGEPQERTEWHRVVFFGKLAEIVQQYLRKGSKIYVEGKLRTSKWQDQSGQDRYMTEVVCDTMQMLDSRGAGGGSSVPFDDGPPPQSGGRGYGSAPQGQAGYAGGSGSPGSGGGQGDAAPNRSYDDFDDEVPF
ncbi:single-stranded DNA-binding protein [Thiococcus pfennigii]|uniref:single-stranded DNA-binding protein n=1 Tax=Thiococcus pfennigii TaxID=1057 RepID=UPI001903A138|nr:single-stranded DNA-binding protein [Thiococcus pfennigii]MBK1701008.1 single-stranded DNA-binding protein [Thiococcus pfennigii]